MTWATRSTAASSAAARRSRTGRTAQAPGVRPDRRARRHLQVPGPRRGRTEPPERRGHVELRARHGRSGPAVDQQPACTARQRRDPGLVFHGRAGRRLLLPRAARGDRGRALHRLRQRRPVRPVRRAGWRLHPRGGRHRRRRQREQPRGQRRLRSTAARRPRPTSTRARPRPAAAAGLDSGEPGATFECRLDRGDRDLRLGLVQRLAHLRPDRPDRRHLHVLRARARRGGQRGRGGDVRLRARHHGPGGAVDLGPSRRLRTTPATSSGRSRASRARPPSTGSSAAARPSGTGRRAPAAPTTT